MNFTTLFEYRIFNKRICHIVDIITNNILFKKKGFYLACANPHSLVVAKNDLIFEKALKQADLLIPDGSGVVFAGKILDKSFGQKIAGEDIFLALLKRLNSQKRGRCFFLGSSVQVLKLIEKKLSEEFPFINVCGIYSPPFKDEFDEEDNISMINAVNKAKPDVLWVGMTAPKQEKWIYQNHKRLDVSFIAAIGAVFDFYAGTKKRSSGLWIKLGLEWLPRFLREPRRLWERNVKSTPIFLWWILKEKIKTYRIKS